jgi:hypothetical protein
MPYVMAQWVEDGGPLCTATDTQEHVYIVSDGAGGAIIAWDDDRDYQDIYAQRVNNLGEILWAANGVLVCGVASPNLRHLASDGAGGALFVWDDYRTFSSRDVYAQRIGANGAVYWPADGVYLASDGRTGGKYARIACDGSKGGIAVWNDERTYGTTLTDIYANGVDSLGNVWAADGIPIATVGGIQKDPHIAPDGAGGAIMAWEDYRGTYPNNHSIFAQRVDGDGAVLWTANGVALANLLSKDVLDPFVVSDGKGGAIVAWQDNRSFYDIYAQRIDGGGNVKWTANGVAVCAAAEWQGRVRAIPDGEGGAIITWWDNRDVDGDIFAQRVDSLGNTLWTADGVPVCTDPGESYQQLDIAPDGEGGAVIVWNDGRGADTDIYAQRIDADGNPLWAVDGVLVCGAAEWQYYPAIASDGAHGAIVAWEDERNADTDIYFNSVNYAGDQKVATLLAGHSAQASGDGITIRWTLSERDPDIAFHVLRSKGIDESLAELEAQPIEEDRLSFAFTDKSCEAGRTYRYRIDVSVSGERRALFETGGITMPELALKLHQNFPNPFNPNTIIRYTLPRRTHVSLKIFDTAGRLVRILVDGHQDRGEREIAWDGRGELGSAVTSGIYYYSLTAGKSSVTRKMVLLR